MVFSYPKGHQLWGNSPFLGQGHRVSSKTTTLTVSIRCLSFWCLHLDLFRGDSSLLPRPTEKPTNSLLSSWHLQRSPRDEVVEHFHYPFPTGVTGQTDLLLYPSPYSQKSRRSWGSLFVFCRNGEGNWGSMDTKLTTSSLRDKTPSPESSVTTRDLFLSDIGPVPRNPLHKLGVHSSVTRFRTGIKEFRIYFYFDPHLLPIFTVPVSHPVSRLTPVSVLLSPHAFVSSSLVSLSAILFGLVIKSGGPPVLCTRLLSPRVVPIKTGS